ncbi:hypothetical protein BDV38DRAFT_276620 [Aspergillus pseudotamarii]|uniref:Uncharacterized protein n=1 Tax=Aspergillus pseudotamarii TaxID=132259 RepID=A0A5N6TAY0_ASPPS|nr:uncharacterized protein BDV38DRAFT_276620 [Aspergillus pseudotamarii]KAE8143535.1 hypothetical protein BDV38DRAFT_276620 [Aspergillus pseudotamarii]
MARGSQLEPSVEGVEGAIYSRRRGSRDRKRGWSRRKNRRKRRKYVGSSLLTPASTLTTTTSTHCATIKACSAQATTTTTTISSDGSITTQMEGLFPAPSADSAKWSSIQSSILSRLASYDAIVMPRLTSTSTASTSEATTSTSTTTSPTASETSYDCEGSDRCKTFANLRSFCDMAKSFLKDDITYQNTEGECYTDGKNAGYGCGVFIEAKDCEMKGREIAVAYDHIHQETGGDCAKCGSAWFSDGCRVKVDYGSGCKATNGPLEPVPGNPTISSASASFIKLRTRMILCLSSIQLANLANGEDR